MKKFKGLLIPPGFDLCIDEIVHASKTSSICMIDYNKIGCRNFVCYKCLLSSINRPTLREYLATLGSPQPFAAGTVINSHHNLEIMASFTDGDELYYAVMRCSDDKCYGLYIISSKKLLHDMNQCRIELIAQNKLHKQTIDENQVQIDALEKLLEGKE